MGFKKSLSQGKDAEQYVVSLITVISSDIEISKESEYDIKLCVNIPLTFEVKYDVYANKSGNVAFEYWNSKKNLPSGINVTEADIWVQVLSENEIYMIETHKLKKLITDITPKRIVENVGDGNANIMLYGRDFLDNFVLVNMSNIQDYINDVQKYKIQQAGQR